MSSDLPAGAPRAAVLDDYQGVALASGPWEKLAGRLQVEVYTDHLADPVDLVARLAPFEVVVAMRERTRFDRQVIESLPHLRLLVTTGARNAAIDMAACARQGITVCGTGGLGHGTAELTWALILAAVRHLPTELASVRSGGWMTKVGGDLVGSCLGVVGLGRLGTQVARVGQAFGMDVVAWSPHLTEARAAEVGVQAVSKEELFARSDVVSIHLVLSESTQGTVGAAELARMKPTAWLVNTSRGPICDEAALVAACRSHSIAGACLDAYAQEPLPVDHPFRTLPNVLASPHVGYVTARGYARFFEDVVEDIAGWLDGQPVRILTP